MIPTVRSFFLVCLAAVALSACGTEETKHARNDMPANWWSDNYIAMWQGDADEVGTINMGKAKPMALPK